MRPHVILHNQVSLDGRITGFAPDMELHYGAAAEFGMDAHLAGCDTLLAIPEAIPPEDDSAFAPPQTDPDDRRPLLVVPDSRGRMRCWHYLRRQPFWRGMVSLCSRTTPADHLEYLAARHVACIVAGDDHVDLAAALVELAERYGVKTVMTDSGGVLNGVMLRAGLVDEISVLISPHLVGSDAAGGLIRGTAAAGDGASVRLELHRVDTAKDHYVWLRYRVVAES